MIETKAFAAYAADKPLAPWSFQRREPKPHDVVIDILFCGICHSDLHTVRGEWGGAKYPLAPGHEIVGRVSRVGDAVRKLKVGDMAGVGCLVDSCRECSSCKDGLEQYCEKGGTGTYGSPDPDTGVTQGGYTSHIVVDENYVLRVPANLALEGVAPLLCAGITTYSPLRHWKVGPGQKVAVLGLGGLGHMGVKLAAAMGAEVTMLSGSPKKEADAKRLGATAFLLTSDREAMKRAKGTFDLIVDTVSADHDLSSYLRLLKRDGTIVMVGGSPDPFKVPAFSLIMGRKSLAGSSIGGIAETQEMLDFCGQHGIVSDVEVIAPEQINEAYERMLKSDVRYRFVIDIKKL